MTSSARPDSSSTQLASDPTPLEWREVLAVGLFVVVADVAIYHGQGFAGYAMLFLVAPWLLRLGVASQPERRSASILYAMLLVLVLKLVWCGTIWQVVIGFVLLVAFAMSLAGLVPYFPEVGLFASQVIVAGYMGLIHYARSIRGRGPRVQRSAWLNFGLPLVTFALFSLLFILANPHLLEAFGERLQLLLQEFREWILDFSPSPWEFIFWVLTAWVCVGLLRPIMRSQLVEEPPLVADLVPSKEDPPVRTVVYTAYRNTLATVIGLFAVYLAFEFKTLWFRAFPDGFYYSGYAHQGAAWLTVALALATVILSAVFRGSVLRDPRLPALRCLSWVWAAQNFLLAVAVYNRLFIYIGFNGMTRMRMVGLFGISAVVAGMLLVLWKIARNRSFLWLVRRQLWALGITIYLFVLTPVDTFVVRYNVRRILRGDPAPSVQISVHPIGSEGVLHLLPLVDCEDALVREGVRALLAQRDAEAERLAARQSRQGWTSWQISDALVLRRLRARRADWTDYRDAGRRAAALDRFHEYAYQWF